MDFSIPGISRITTPVTWHFVLARKQLYPKQQQHKGRVKRKQIRRSIISPFQLFFIETRMVRIFFTAIAGWNLAVNI
jgi:hypothetical protein